MSRPAEPLLSVVMPVYRVEAYLRDAIESVRRQTYTNLEIILVDDGSPDSCGQICDRYAEQDSRIRVLHQSNAGLSVARNNGAARATGEFLAFIDSDDLLFDDSYRALVSSLLRSGSDFATGNVQRFNVRSRWQAWNQHSSHTTNRVGTDLLKHPELLYDTVAWNKVFRREFFVRNHVSFPEGKLYEDMVPMFRAYRAARSVDVLRQPVYLWRMREGKDSITQQRSDFQNLADRVQMIDTIFAELQDLGVRELEEVFYRKILEGDLWIYVRNLSPQVTREFRTLLVEAVRTYWTMASTQAKASIPQERRVLYRAVSDGTPELLGPIRAWYAERRGRLPISYEAGELCLDNRELPSDWPALSQLDRTFTLESRLKSHVREVSWDDDDRLHVRGWAFLPLLPPEEQTVRLWLDEPSTGERVEVPLTTGLPSPAAAVASQDAERDFAQVGFEGVLDTRALGALASGGYRARTWLFTVDVRTPQLTRSTALTSFTTGGATSVITPRFVDEQVQVVPLAVSRQALALELRRPRVVVDDLRVDGREVTVGFRCPPAARLESSPGGPEVARWHDDALDREHWVDIERLGPHHARMTFQVPRTTDGHLVTWRPQVTVDGTRRPLAWGRAVASVGPRDTAGLTVRCSGRGWFVLTDSAETLDIVAAGVEDGPVVTVEGVLAEPAEQVELALVAEGNGHARWTTATVSGRLLEARLALWDRDWYDTARPRWSGLYRLRARRITPGAGEVADAGATPLHVAVTPELAAGFLHPYACTTASVQLQRLDGHDLAVRLSAPVPPEERSAHARQRVVQAFGPGAQVKPEDSIFLRTNAGYAANDSALYLQREIERRELPITVYWGVRHLAVPIPPGGIPVLDGSREWYEKLARSRWVVNNYGGIWNYPGHAHQTYLQTWHGTPYKSIGMSEAIHLGGDHSEIERLRTEGAQWDYLLSPSPYCSKLLPAELCYDGPTLELGMPRNDFVATATPEDTRRLRRRLGIDPDRRVVLYAPTFREAQRVGLHATMYRGLDLQALADRLGDDWVILARGHSFTARTGDRLPESRSVRDVTDVPDVAELYVAADACITDYSSVMFDFAVTGRPLYYFTPDLEAFVASRSVYFDLEELAPSTLHVDPVELAEDLRDIEGYEARYGARYRQFQQTFAPWDDGRAAQRLADVLFG